MISNQYDGAREAIEAGKAWLSANNSDNKGDALAIEAFVAAWAEFEGNFTVEDESFDFTLESFGNPLTREGKRDNKATAARMAALGAQFFGLPLEEDGRLAARYQSRINRAYYAAQYLRQEFKSECKIVKGNLQVPGAAVLPVPTEKASDAEKTLYEVMKSQPVVLDGKNFNGTRMSLAELGKRADKWHNDNGSGKTKRGTKAKDGSPQSLAKALEYVETVLHDSIRKDGEPAEAFTKDMELRLFRITQHAAAYFAAHPLEDVKAA